jgi:hypothetical protein
MDTNYVTNTILNEENEEFEEKISLDDLYEGRENADAFQIEIYKKVLTRIHKKIRLTAKQKTENTYSFFLVPEIMFGSPKYDTQKCITYVIEKLVNNGFHIKYTHPNLIFISWNHYIPNFKRDAIKEKTGITVDGFGNIVNKKNNSGGSSAINFPTLPSTVPADNKTIDSKYKDISKYKPSGIYDESMLMTLK